MYRLAEYSTTKQCTIFVGTWNLNGRVSIYVIAEFADYVLNLE